MHCFLLCANLHFSSPDPLSYWETQSLLHLWLPLDCGNPVLWKHLLCLFTALVQVHCSGPTGYNSLHCPVLHAQPFHLQFEKQRPEEGPGEADGQEEILVRIFLDMIIGFAAGF